MAPESETENANPLSKMENIDLEQQADSTSLGTQEPVVDLVESLPPAVGDDDDFATKGIYLRWSRLHKVVEVKDQSAGGLVRSNSISASYHAGKVNMKKSEGTATKTILSHLSGCAVPGEVLALMGPSGSGKTSLMNCLSGRASYQEGVISINGDPINYHSMKRLMARVAYVKQADVFFEHLSVRDQFTYTALLRLPSSMTTMEKHEEVDKLIRQLRLSKVADSPISMVSGGEKKRVNIGTELLTNPLLLMLDEPTSGLDSTSAVSLLKLLQSLAREQKKTIMTSIHQPSSAVFSGFDKLMMLSEGNVVYFGTPSDSLSYLDKRHLSCPPGYNAADHWMDLLVIDNAVEEERLEALAAEKKSVSGSNDVPAQDELHGRRFGDSTAVPPRLLLAQAWDAEAVAVSMDAALLSNADDASSVHEELLGGSKYATSWSTQFRVLLHRALKNSRSAIFTPLNLIKSVALGLIVGLLWFRKSYTEANVFDIRSYYFFTMTYWVFDSMFAALMSFPTERVVILKERASGSYHLSAYFLSKTLSEVPVLLILPFLYMIISYWLGMFDKQISVFFGTVGCTLLSVVAGESFGLMIGATMYDLEKAITFMTVFTLFLMLLGGFFVEDMPGFISWAKYISPFKYASDSSLQVIFDRPIPCDGSGALGSLCGDNSTGYASAEDVLAMYGVQGSLWFNIGLLLVLCIVPRYGAYLALRWKKEGERGS